MDRGADLARRYERLVKGRDFVRRAATLLSTDMALPELFGQLAALLNEFLEAPGVSIVLSDEAAAHLDFTFGGEGEVASVLAVPIPFGGTAIGSLSVSSNAQNAYDDEDRALLETCAFYLGARVHDEAQREKSAALERLATTDALTGLTNRRGLDDVLLQEWRRCERSQHPLSLALLDVDFFKRFNDAYGHVAGDACLRQIAQALAACVKRPGDAIARYGGEEFAFVLPDTDEAGGIALAESVCHAVSQLAIPHEGSTLGHVTVSVGVGTLVPRLEDEPRTLIAAADAMLYAAKETGRNCVASGEYRSSRPPAMARVVMRYSLPRYVTPTVGRERDVEAVSALLQESRLVTIAGPGGIGKTRLSVQVALQSVGAQADGTWFADLAPLSDPDLVATTLAGAIGLKLGPGSDTISSIVTFLRPQEMLVVLDNCEHVIEGAARVADAIADACPRVRILATSREPLGIEGETVYRLDTLDDASACELFVERLRRADRNAPLAPGDVATIAEICRRLDGVPLAIELAAARARAMPLEQLQARLDERFRLLTGVKRADVPHHQTLLASIAWSYDLLSDDQRSIFQRLAAFSGGFSLEAATRVVGDDATETWETVDAIAALVDKSMIAYDGGSERYRMLESIRQYALQRLTERGELERARRAHAEYFADLAATASAEYGHSAQDAWLARYETDLDNFRAALDWAMVADLALAARMIGQLSEYWDYCGLVSEGLRRSEAVLARLDDRPDAELAPVLLAVAHLSSSMRSYRRALEAGERALAISERLGDPYLLARVRRTTGAVRYVIGSDPERATSDLRLALEYFRSHENLVRRMGAIYAYALTLEPELGRPLFLEALALANSSGWTRFTVAIEMNLSERDFWSGNVEAARERTRRAISLSRNRRAPLDLAMALANLGSYSCVSGAYDEALSAAGEAATIARAHDLPYPMAIAMQVLAVVRAAQGEVRVAARLLGYVEACYATFNLTLERTEARVREQLLWQLHAGLDETEIVREKDAGARLSMNEAYALGLGRRVDEGATP